MDVILMSDENLAKIRAGIYEHILGSCYQGVVSDRELDQLMIDLHSWNRRARNADTLSGADRIDTSPDKTLPKRLAALRVPLPTVIETYALLRFLEMRCAYSPHWEGSACVELVEKNLKGLSEHYCETDPEYQQVYEGLRDEEETPHDAINRQELVSCAGSRVSGDPESKDRKSDPENKEN